MTEMFALIGDSFQNPDYIKTALDKIIKVMMGKQIAYTKVSNQGIILNINYPERTVNN